MDSTLKDIVKSKIDKLKALDFQNFINEFFIIYYGNDFTVIKQKHDKGSDGIINDDTIIACYAPESINIKDFEKKIDCIKKGKEGDFQKYQANWQTTHPNWTVIYNGEWSSPMVMKVQSLKNNAGRLGQVNILNMIDELSWTKQNHVFKLLNIDDEYIRIDHLQQVIEDLIKVTEQGNNKNQPNSVNTNKNLPIDLDIKIELNYTGTDIDIAKLEATEYLQIAHLISDILTEFTQFPALKLKVQKDYLQLNPSLSFKERKQILKENYAGKRKIDETYCHYVDMFLLYIFEQCLIGKKTKN